MPVETSLTVTVSSFSKAPFMDIWKPGTPRSNCSCWCKSLPYTRTNTVYFPSILVCREENVSYIDNGHLCIWDSCHFGYHSNPPLKAQPLPLFATQTVLILTSVAYSISINCVQRINQWIVPKIMWWKQKPTFFYLALGIFHNMKS